jgi:hypothetical protein
MRAEPAVNNCPRWNRTEDRGDGGGKDESREFSHDGVSGRSNYKNFNLKSLFYKGQSLR